MSAAVARIARAGTFMRNWFRVEIVPIYVIAGIAVVGAGWYLSRLARGPKSFGTK